MRPSIEAAIEEQTGADAGAQRKKDEGVHLGGGPAPLLAEGAAARVALDEDRNAVAFFEERSQRDVDPSFEIAGAHHFAMRVDRSGHGQAKRRHAAAAAGNRRDLLVEDAEDGFDAFVRRRLDLVGIDVLAAVGFAGEEGHLAPADVDGDQVRLHG